MNHKLREWWLRLLGTFRTSDPGMDDELRFHLEMAEQDSLRRGAPVREARLRAGAITQAGEAVRDQGTFVWLADFLRDTRYGVRLLARSPLFTTAAIVSLALGIGANTAIFSLVDAVMLRMMPVRQPERLVEFIKYREPYGRAYFSYPLYRQLRGEAHTLEGLLARASLGKREAIFGTEPEMVNIELVSGNYYSVLGVSAAAGRTFGDEVERDPAPVAVISYAFWKRRFGLDPAVVGKTFRLNRTIFTIVGVTPPEFSGVAPGESLDITLPITLDAEARGGDSWLPSPSRGWLAVIGRLAPGQSPAQALVEVSAIFSRAIQTEARRMDKDLFRKQALAQRMTVEPAGNGLNLLRARFSDPLRVLMGIVALVLLIACANLANLLLSRSAARRREIGIRLAIGAGPGRVIRQLLAEGLLLAAAGGALGVFLACWSANALVSVMSNGGDRIALHIRPDLRVLAFAATVSIAACLAFCLAPALQAARQGIPPALAEARGARWRLGRGLIATQVAVSVMLLIGAGLFARTLLSLYSLETGFDRSHVLLFSLKDDHAALRGTELRARLLQDLRSLPGIESASFGMSPIGAAGWDRSVRVEGYTPRPDEDDRAVLNAVETHYFKTTRTPVVMGREFNQRDTAASPKVAVVNEAFARRYFPGRSPLGKWANLGGDPDRLEIVGVVKDIRSRSSRQEASPAVFLAATQAPQPVGGGYLVRGSAAPPIVTAAIERIDPGLRADDIHTLDEHLSRGILQERIMGTLSGFFGALSLLLVAVGIYGVMAFQVARRRKEIGIRLALGARPSQVTGMVLSETARPLALGIAAGLAGALALTRLLEKMLFGIKATDPLTFTAACGLLITLALLAAYMPSRVAARLSPVETLRCE